MREMTQLDAFLRLRLSPGPRLLPQAQETSKRYFGACPPNAPLTLSTASEPIELTDDDEPKVPPPKRQRKAARKASSANVIDLCSDDHETTPRPPRKPRKSQARAPPEDEVIVLLSSDNEGSSHSKEMTNGRKSFSPAASMPSIEMLRPEENDFAAATGNANQQPELPPPQLASPPASPVARAHVAQPLTDQQAKEAPPDEDGITSGPLQHIYNEAFQNRSRAEKVDLPSPVFSWKARSKPTPVCEPLPLPSSNPSLLTPGFFKRVRDAFAVPQNLTTSVQSEPVKGSSPDLQRPTTTVKSDPIPITPSCVAYEVGERECPEPLLPGPSPRKSQAECVTAVEEITEDNSPPGVSPPEVVEAGALHTASLSSPVKEPNSSKTPQSEFTERPHTPDIHETTTTTRCISPPTPPPKTTTTSKTMPTDSRQTNAIGPSETEMREIEAMLLPETSNDITDEQLLAMGLCYPEY